MSVIGTTQLRVGRLGPPASESVGKGHGVGRPRSTAAEAVSDDLRRTASAELAGRRQVAALSLGSIAALGMVTAYQYGLIRHLPEPPLRVFDADRVDASGEAYELGKLPDGTLGIINASLTLALAGIGGAGRWRDRPWLPLALAAKVAADAAGSLFLTAEQMSKHRRLCAWCLAAAACSLVAVPAPLVEARPALRRVLGR